MVHSYMYLPNEAEKPYICLSFCQHFFAVTLTTQHCLHQSTPDKLKIKALSFETSMFVFKLSMCQPSTPAHELHGC